MLSEKLFGATKLPLLKAGLDAYSLRNRAIANNVANAETYGYKRKSVVFESKLRTALKHTRVSSTNPKHLKAKGLDLNQFQPELQTDETPSDINDVSNVDIDREMGDLAKNHLQFTYASRMSKLYYDLIRESIRGI